MKLYRILSATLLLAPCLFGEVPFLPSEVSHRDMANLKWTSVAGIKPVESSVGHGELIAGRLEEDLRPVKVGGRAIRDGIFAHAPSRLTYEVKDGGYKVLRGKVAVEDGYGLAKVKFRILGDGKELWRSKEIKIEKKGKDADVVSFAVPIEGVSKVELVVEDLGNRADDHSIWIKPEFGK